MALKALDLTTECSPVLCLWWPGLRGRVPGGSGCVVPRQYPQCSPSSRCLLLAESSWSGPVSTAGQPLRATSWLASWVTTYGVAGAATVQGDLEQITTQEVVGNERRGHLVPVLTH